MQISADIQHYFDQRHPKTCFEVLDRNAIPDDIIECMWTHPGQYPPAKATLTDGRCCFREPLSSGLFWAIGQNTMSHLMTIVPETYPGEVIANAHPDSRLLKFEIYPAVLVDIIATDSMTDEPITDARVTMADDAIHLLSYAKWTDSDGYAVMPMIPGETYVITVRASHYLNAEPFEVTLDVPRHKPSSKPDLQTLEGLAAADTDTDEDTNPQADTEALPVIEYVVEMDPGICISGQVKTPDDQPLLDAEIHAEVTQSDGKIYDSDIDQPMPMSALATFDTVWMPAYNNESTDYHGQFELCTLPRGMVRLYATHDDYPPSDWLSVDARDSDDLAPVTIQMTKGHQAWVRVEDKVGRALSMILRIYDSNTNTLIDEIETPESGAIQISALPDHARFVITSEDGPSTEYSRTISDNDEIVLTAEDTYNNYTFHIVAKDSNGQTDVNKASIHILDPNLQKKYPDCLSETDQYGSTKIDFCPGAFWAVIAHTDYGNEYIYINADKPDYEAVLNSGQTYYIEFNSGNQPVDARCTLVKDLKADNAEDYKWTEYHHSQNGHLKLMNMGSNQYIECTNGEDTVSAMLMTDAAPGHTNSHAVYQDSNHLRISFPQKNSRNIIILDAFGSPVPYARFEMDSKTYEADEQGRYENLRGIPGHEIEIYHYHHGRTKVLFEAGTSEYEIHLPDKIDPELTSCLERHHIQYITDSASVRIDMPIEKMQILRGDYIESCNDHRLVVVRDDRRIESKW